MKVLGILKSLLCIHFKITNLLKAFSKEKLTTFILLNTKLKRRLNKTNQNI